MKFPPPILHPLLSYSFLFGVLAAAAIGCNKASNIDVLRGMYPIPTELPEATCKGANTVGARFDSILFVANYFPNTSSWGSPTPEDGVTAYFRYPTDGSTSYIEVSGLHPIRPVEIDGRRMNSTLWYYPIEDSLGLLIFSYVGGGVDLSVKKMGIPKHLAINIFFDPVDSILCGTIPTLRLSETSSVDIGDPEIYDTILVRDYRLDVSVKSSRN